MYESIVKAMFEESWGKRFERKQAAVSILYSSFVSLLFGADGSSGFIASIWIESDNVKSVKKITKLLFNEIKKLDGINCVNVTYKKGGKKNDGV